MYMVSEYRHVTDNTIYLIPSRQYYNNILTVKLIIQVFCHNLL